ncbi:hypothetical protein N183_30540 [Sinorhizobium sp. Sb3]|nr:hypothetical protein N183_30540 [Sinorhizobium sp. Sb3]
MYFLISEITKFAKNMQPTGEMHLLTAISGTEPMCSEK